MYYLNPLYSSHLLLVPFLSNDEMMEGCEMKDSKISASLFITWKRSLGLVSAYRFFIHQYRGQLFLRRYHHSIGCCSIHTHESNEIGGKVWGQSRTAWMQRKRTEKLSSDLLHFYMDSSLLCWAVYLFSFICPNFWLRSCVSSREFATFATKLYLHASKKCAKKHVDSAALSVFFSWGLSTSDYKPALDEAVDRNDE